MLEFHFENLLEVPPGVWLLRALDKPGHDGPPLSLFFSSVSIAWPVGIGKLRPRTPHAAISRMARFYSIAAARISHQAFPAT
jgi:hypothetical protein